MTVDDHLAPDDDRATAHLANERTYFAWMRTGVATMRLRFVIAKLKYIFGPAYPQPASSTLQTWVCSS
jgi:uncharacterized membrane protein YidH (DUF202 family)